MAELDPRPAVRALVERDGRYLLLLADLGEGRRWWTLPGGGVEPGESPRAALRREVREETGLSVGVVEPVGCFAFSNESLGWHVVNTVFAATVPDGTVTLDGVQDEPLVDADWFAPDEVGDLPLAPGESRFFERF